VVRHGSLVLGNSSTARLVVHGLLFFFPTSENVHPGHMIGGFDLIEQDCPMSIQTLDSRHESVLAAIEEAKKRRTGCLYRVSFYLLRCIILTLYSS
jgi:hypothetical protein